MGAPLWYSIKLNAMGELHRMGEAFRLSLEGLSTGERPRFI